MPSCTMEVKILWFESSGNIRSNASGSQGFFAPCGSAVQSDVQQTDVGNKMFRGSG